VAAVAGDELYSIGPLLRALARQARADMKDKRYQLSPVGETVGRYLDDISYGGAKPGTIESYEQPLAWLGLEHADLGTVADFCERPELVRDFMHSHWADASENTRVHRWRVLNLFFGWCVENGLMPWNPMRGIRKPKAPRTLKERRAYEQDMVRTLIDAQDPLRDRCALGLLRLAIRKNDLRMLRLGEIDLARDVVYLNHAKGRERHQLPIVFADLRSDLAAHLAERTLEAGRDPAGEYLLYPRERRLAPMDPSSVHRWFKGCLENAGLPDTIQMHELRHTAGDHIWRTTGNLVLAQKLLRHKSPATTAAYLHPSEDDLRGGLRRVEETWQR